MQGNGYLWYVPTFDFGAIVFGNTFAEYRSKDHCSRAPSTDVKHYYIQLCPLQTPVRFTVSLARLTLDQRTQRCAARSRKVELAQYMSTTERNCGEQHHPDMLVSSTMKLPPAQSA